MTPTHVMLPDLSLKVGTWYLVTMSIIEIEGIKHFKTSFYNNYMTFSSYST